MSFGSCPMIRGPLKRSPHLIGSLMQDLVICSSTFPEGVAMKLIVALLSLISAHASALTLTTEEYPPYNFSKDGGKVITGSATDVMNEVIKRTGIKASTRTPASIRPHGRKPARSSSSGLDRLLRTAGFSTPRTTARSAQKRWTTSRNTRLVAIRATPRRLS